MSIHIFYFLDAISRFIKHIVYNFVLRKNFGVIFAFICFLWMILMRI